METIRITITSENPASIVITKQRTVNKEEKRKAALAWLDAIFKPVIKEVSK
jgi:hypothetical protein